MPLKGIKIFFSIYLIVLLSICNADAQQLLYTRFNEESGLNSSMVYFILEDKKGYIWMSTDAGVCRFDGNTFQQFNTSHGLSDNEVLKMFEDRTGRIWFLTLNGRLSYFKDEKIYNESHDPLLKKSFSGDAYNSFYEDQKGRLFFGTSGGFLLVIDGEKISHHTYKGLALGECTFFEDRNSKVYLESGYTYLYDNDGLILLNKKPLSFTMTRNMFSVNNDALYLNDEGLFKNGKFGERKLLDNSELPFDNEKFAGCRKDAEDNLWLYYWNSGAYKYIWNGSHYKLDEIFHPGKSIHATLTDREGNIWFCCYGEGVYLLQGNKIEVRQYNIHSGLINENIHSLEVLNDKIIAGCNNRIVSILENNKVRNITLPGYSSSYERVRNVKKDTKGNLWFVTDVSVYRMDKDKNPVIINAHGENKRKYNYSPKAISFDKKGRGIITSSKKMLVTNEKCPYDKICITDFIYPPDSALRTYCHYITRDDKLWIATIKGLYQWENNTLTPAYFPVKSGGRVICMGETADSSLIICTDNEGLIILKNGKIAARLNTSNGLLSDLCRNIRVYNDTLLISTNRGITIAQYKMGNFHGIRSITSSEGIASIDVHDALMHNNYIYAGTEKGITVLEKESKRKRGNPPPLYITKIIEGKNELNPGSDISLPYNRNHLIIYFTGITYQNPSLVEYQYKLTTGNVQWTSTNNNFIEAASLSPGRYTFQLRARKQNSGWSEPVDLVFTIHQPYWSMTWFKMLVAAFATALAFGIGFLFHRNKIRHETLQLEKIQALNKERLRIASDLHDDIGTGLTQISMIAEVAKRNHGIEKSVLEKITNLSHGLVDNMSEIIWTINSSNNSLKALTAYLTEYTLNFCESHQIKADINVEVPEEDVNLSAIIRRNIFLLLKESLTNTLKHAHATGISLDISYKNKFIEMSIKDNGKGYNMDEVNGRGNGLGNMKKRIREVNGDILCKSAPGEGTDLFFRIPAETED